MRQASRTLQAIVVVAALGIGVPAKSADDATRSFAARTELYSVPSLTLTDQEFLLGAGGSPCADARFRRFGA